MLEKNIYIYIKIQFRYPNTIHLHHTPPHTPSPYIHPANPALLATAFPRGEWFLMLLFRVFRGVPDGIRAYKTKSDPSGRAHFSSFTISGSRCSFFSWIKSILIACRGDSGVCFGAVAGRVFMRIKNIFWARVAFCCKNKNNLMARRGGTWTLRANATWALRARILRKERLCS